MIPRLVEIDHKDPKVRHGVSINRDTFEVRVFSFAHQKEEHTDKMMFFRWNRGKQINVSIPSNVQHALRSQNLEEFARPVTNERFKRTHELRISVLVPVPGLLQKQMSLDFYSRAIYDVDPINQEQRLVVAFLMDLDKTYGGDVSEVYPTKYRKHSRKESHKKSRRHSRKSTKRR